MGTSGRAGDDRGREWHRSGANAIDGKAATTGGETPAPALTCPNCGAEKPGPWPGCRRCGHIDATLLGGANALPRPPARRTPTAWRTPPPWWRDWRIRVAVAVALVFLLVLILAYSVAAWQWVWLARRPSKVLYLAWVPQPPGSIAILTLIVPPVALIAIPAAVWLSVAPPGAADALPRPPWWRDWRTGVAVALALLLVLILAGGEAVVRGFTQDEEVGSLAVVPLRDPPVLVLTLIVPPGALVAIPAAVWLVLTRRR